MSINIMNTTVTLLNPSTYVMKTKTDGIKFGHIIVKGGLVICECYNNPEYPDRGLSTVYMRETKCKKLYTNNAEEYKHLECCVRYAEAFTQKFINHKNGIVKYVDKYRNMIIVDYSPVSVGAMELDAFLHYKIPVIEVLDIKVGIIDRVICENDLIKKICEINKNKAIISITDDIRMREALVRNGFIDINGQIGYYGSGGTLLYIGNNVGATIHAQLSLLSYKI